jgi:ribokinase
MARVVVLGSSGYDLTIRLPRLPKPGETLLGGELLTGPGGKGANAAIAARRAGANVTFLTAFGDDDFGRRIYRHDLEEGLDLSYAKTVSGVANQVALIFVGDDGQNLIGVAPGASGHLQPSDIDALPDAVFDPNAILLACLEVPLATVEHAFRRAAKRGMRTILNPAPADRALMDRSLLSLVSVLTPNQEEARILTGAATDTPRSALYAATMLRSYGAEQVVITLGEMGCAVAGALHEDLIPAYPVTVVDTVGAGDAFNGALAVALAERVPLADAARWACAAGAIAVTRPGAQGALPTRDEIDQRIAQALTGAPRSTERIRP